ncbi:hypothetical protein [Roseibium sp.]|uniref:hypothetical protein n=1 Tax=Roseibium sp. TaxID=1936156 RepID=UPI003BACC389
MRIWKTVVVAAVGGAWSLFVHGGAPAYADMMAACKSEISAQCNGVRKGRGRIAACLYAHPNKLSAPCAAEVEKVSNSRTTKAVIPAGVQKLSGSQYEGDLVKACGNDARKLCPGVSGNQRNLACLYSRSNQISGSCKKTADRVLKLLR